MNATHSTAKAYSAIEAYQTLEAAAEALARVQRRARARLLDRSDLEMVDAQYWAARRLARALGVDEHECSATVTGGNVPNSYRWAGDSSYAARTAAGWHVVRTRADARPYGRGSTNRIKVPAPPDMTAPEAQAWLAPLIDPSWGACRKHDGYLVW